MELDTDQLKGNEFITKPTIHSGREKKSQNNIGQIPEQSALSRLTSQNRVGCKYLCCL